MNNKEYHYLRHIGAALIAGLLFSLGVGFLLGFKVALINEATHQFRYAYPFLLNFVPLYLLLGLIFGAAVGLIGGALMRSSISHKISNFPLAFGLSFLAFLILFLIFRAPLGPMIGMFLALLTFIALDGTRPPLSRLYFSIFFTAVVYNYSWQWVRQHFIVNPLLPLPRAQLLDFVFTLVWAILCLLAFRLFLKRLFKLPVRAFYATGLILTVLFVLLGGGYYLIRPKALTAQPAAPIEIARRPTDTRIVLVGVDGLWWKILDPLRAQNKLPNLNKLIESGASGPLETLFPTFSSTIWSSISTGKSPEKHDVTSFLVWKFPWTGFALPCFKTPKIAAEMDWMREALIITAPMNNQFLQATPLWDILSDHGATVGTVNWWLSYPAYPVQGFIVSDHCLYNKEYVMENFKEREGDTPYDIYPQSLLKELLPYSRSPQDLSEAEIQRFIHIDSPKFLQEFRAIDTYDYLDIAYEASMFKYSFPEDLTFAGATHYLLTTQQPDFLCVYLDGMDSMQHQYLKYYFADQHPDKLLPENLKRYRDLITNYYIYIDEVIGSFTAVTDSNTIFMVVSDHGFDETMMPTGHYNHVEAPSPGSPPEAYKNMHPGVFICAGPGIQAHYQVEDAHVYDITPTVLHLLGLPTAEDFDGEVLTEMLEDSSQVETIPTYESGRRAQRQILRSGMDDAYKEKLKALGYTQ